MIRVKYGREFQPVDGREWTDLAIEYYAFREGLTRKQGGLGKDVHFLNIIRDTWPETEIFEWYEEQAHALCNNDVVGFTSGASCAKSDILGKWAIVNYQADPVGTLVIVCSTTALDARQRIWAHIVRDYRRARAQKKSVGRLIDSQFIIKLHEATDGIATSDNSAISLVAAGDQYKDDALKRLQGRKAMRRMFLILDELQDCSKEITDFAIWNLNAAPYFHVSAAGNASKRSDPHGTYMKPLEGWGSWNRKTHKWRIKVGTKTGVGVHFDATADDSPNMRRYLEGRPQLPFLRKAEDVLEAKKLLGEDSPQFMRQFVGGWPDKDGESNWIVTDAELAAYKAYESATATWKTMPTNFAGIDPAYSEGGDRFTFYHLEYGLTTDNIWVINFREPVKIQPNVAPGETRDYANIRACKEEAAKRGIGAQHVGLDASAGSALLSIAHREWSPLITGVQFGGAPSDKQISHHDKRSGDQVYANRTSELAYVFKEFLIAGQIRGITPQHAKELTNRTWEIVGGNKIKVETKLSMKKRLGYSPDYADAGNIGLDIIRDKLRILAGNPQATTNSQEWREFRKQKDVAGRTDMSRRPPIGRQLVGLMGRH